MGEKSFAFILEFHCFFILISIIGKCEILFTFLYQISTKMMQILERKKVAARFFLRKSQKKRKNARARKRLRTNYVALNKDYNELNAKTQKIM